MANAPLEISSGIPGGNVRFSLNFFLRNDVGIRRSKHASPPERAAVVSSRHAYPSYEVINEPCIRQGRERSALRRGAAGASVEFRAKLCDPCGPRKPAGESRRAPRGACTAKEGRRGFRSPETVADRARPALLPDQTRYGDPGEWRQAAARRGSFWRQRANRR